MVPKWIHVFIMLPNFYNKEKNKQKQRNTTATMKKLTSNKIHIQH